MTVTVPPPEPRFRPSRSRPSSRTDPPGYCCGRPPNDPGGAGSAGRSAADRRDWPSTSASARRQSAKRGRRSAPSVLFTPAAEPGRSSGTWPSPPGRPDTSASGSTEHRGIRRTGSVGQDPGPRLLPALQSGRAIQLRRDGLTSSYLDEPVLPALREHLEQSWPFQPSGNRRRRPRRVVADR